ncbi:FkbM family methyltransferase [Sphingomonas sp. ZB1N12]|uniref:FkbM family methyltransferase n=1 Tax=Sphingomonas arabinosi TaxID=3096160 RepID=UPI002FCA6600
MAARMTCVITMFAGDIPQLVFTARSFRLMCHDLGIERIFIILLTHRRDSESYGDLAELVREGVFPLFGERFAFCLELIGYEDLFPGTKGYLTSATAKSASLMAFAGNHVGIGELVVLEPGEMATSMLHVDHQNDWGKSSVSRVSQFASAHDQRSQQACRLLGIPFSDAPKDGGERFEARIFMNNALMQLDAAVENGLKSIAPKLVSGELACDLCDLHDMWHRHLSSGSHHDRSRAEAAQSRLSDEQSDVVCTEGAPEEPGGYLKIVTLEAARASNHPLAVDEALNLIRDDLAARVAALETFDPSAAARAIDLLNESCGGHVTFVQVGANDGTFLDPIAPFITDRWRGVVVEPIPEYFDLLERRYAQFPKVEAVAGAIGDGPGERTMYFFHRAGTDDPDREAHPEWLKGLASFSAEHLMRHGVAQQDIRALSVPVFRGSDVVRGKLPDSVDLVVIDVEGAEREVLEGFDLAQLKPTLIIFECEHVSEEDELILSDLFDRSGYSVCWSRPDAIAFLASEARFREAFLTSDLKDPERNPLILTA